MVLPPENTAERLRKVRWTFRSEARGDAAGNYERNGGYYLGLTGKDVKFPGAAVLFFRSP
jgi:hypothetical protein